MLPTNNCSIPYTVLYPPLPAAASDILVNDGTYTPDFVHVLVHTLIGRDTLVLSHTTSPTTNNERSQGPRAPRNME